MAEISFGRVLRAAALIGGVPALVLLALLAGGHVSPAPGAVALLACAAAALLLARVWIGDLARLSEALRRAAAAGEEEDEDDGRRRGRQLPAAPGTGAGCTSRGWPEASRAKIAKPRCAMPPGKRRIGPSAPIMASPTGGEPMRAVRPARAAPS